MANWGTQDNHAEVMGFPGPLYGVPGTPTQGCVVPPPFPCPYFPPRAVSDDPDPIIWILYF